MKLIVSYSAWIIHFRTSDAETVIATKIPKTQSSCRTVGSVLSYCTVCHQKVQWKFRSSKLCRLKRRCVVVLSVPPPDSLGLLDYTKPCQAAVTAAAALCLDLIKPPAERVCFSLPRACSVALCVHNTFCTNTKCLFLLLLRLPQTLHYLLTSSPTPEKFASWERAHVTRLLQNKRGAN